MAIYRTGKASLDANGIVTGYGTKWRKSLSLIRVGATIIFIDTPAYATIVDVVSDTELRVTETGGAVVGESSYIILLHDSLSVDGLAQDVAETLRYYQGKENEFARLIELINAMDIEAVQKVVDQMKEEVKKFEENFKQIEAKAAEVERNAQHVDLVKDEVELIHTQTEDLKNQAHSSALQAQSHVNAAAAEVEKAAAEFHKAELEAARAGEEAVKAKAEATRAQAVVDGAKVEVIESAKAEVDRASKEADRAKDEADRAAQLADQMDTTKVMLKSQNLADVEDKQAARRNLGVDNIVHDEMETKVMTASKQMWISVRNRDGYPWGVWDNSHKTWIALKPEQGGTGALTIDGARQNLKVDRVKQDVNMTRVTSSDEKTELRIGQDDWYVFRNSNDSEHGYVPLGVKGGGTGGTTPAEARQGLELERFKQFEQRTEVSTASGEYRLFVGDQGDWGVLNKESSHVALPVGAGGTGATTAEDARKNLGVDNVIQKSSENQFASPDENLYIYINKDSRSWGVWDLSADEGRGAGIPLPMSSGGTGRRDGNIWTDEHHQIGVGDSATEPKSLHMWSQSGNVSPGAFAQALQGRWYDSYWQLGGVRGDSRNLRQVNLNVQDGINAPASFVFRGDQSGTMWSGRGFVANPRAGGWGLESNYGTVPYFVDTISPNDSGWCPAISVGSSSSGGYYLRGAFGTITNNNHSWPELSVKLLGDGMYHRSFNFAYNGNLYTWGSGSNWGGNYDFAKNPSSDRDIKHDIVYTDGSESYNRVMQWKPTMFKYNGSEVQRYGLIAQDLMKIDKEYVKLVPGAPVFEDVIGVNEDGEEYVDRQIETDRMDDTLSLDINVMVADIACAMRYIGKQLEEAKKEIERLKAELESK